MYEMEGPRPAARARPPVTRLPGASRPPATTELSRLEIAPVSRYFRRTRVSPAPSRSFPRERIPACAVKEFLRLPATRAQEPVPLIFKIFAGPQGYPQQAAGYPPGRPAVHHGIHNLVHRTGGKVAEGKPGMRRPGPGGRRLSPHGRRYPPGPRAGPAVSPGGRACPPGRPQRCPQLRPPGPPLWPGTAPGGPLRRNGMAGAGGKPAGSGGCRAGLSRPRDHPPVPVPVPVPVLVPRCAAADGRGPPRCPARSRARRPGAG